MRNVAQSAVGTLVELGHCVTRGGSRGAVNDGANIEELT